MHSFLKFIFGIKIYMFRTVPLSIIRSFHCTRRNGICHTGLLTACEQDQDGAIAVCTVKKTPNDGQRNCPKHVEFYSKNKFEKLVHLVGFIIRILWLLDLLQILSAVQAMPLAILVLIWVLCKETDVWGRGVLTSVLDCGGRMFYCSGYNLL